jgi:hypothetical protein
MRTRYLLFIATACLAASCSSESPNNSDELDASELSDEIAAMDSVWGDIAESEAQLEVAEIELIVDCLESEGYSAHNASGLLAGRSNLIGKPSELVAAASNATPIPSAEEASNSALGYWVDYAQMYGDEEAASLQQSGSEEQSDAESDASGLAPILQQVEELGEGWEQQPAIERMKWEIAFQGEAWAASSKAASELTSEEWESLGYENGTWTHEGSLATAPAGCRGQVLRNLYGEADQQELNGSNTWTWGPHLEIDLVSEVPSEIIDDPTSRDFLDCIGDAGYEDWDIQIDGSLNFNGYWMEQYLPEAATSTEQGTTEVQYSDVTASDIDKYYSVKDEEFEAASIIAECGSSSGYHARISELLGQNTAEQLIGNKALYEEYLSEIESSLSSL